MKKKFPKNFLWGAATSAYQVEGAAYSDGKKASQQDIINEKSYQEKGFATAAIASDHYHHYKEDVALMKEMGFTAYRFSIAWSRIFPEGVGEVNAKGIQFYHDLIDELLKNGIEPIVTLYHYDLPWALVEKYNGWLDRQIVADFEYFASYVINAFKDKVKYWTTINEQSIIVQYWTQKCFIPEELQANNQLRYQINHHMNLAHAIACKLVHELVPNGVVGAALGYAPVYPLTSKPEDVMAAQNAHDLRNAYYLDIYFKGIYTKSAMIYLEENGLAPVIEAGDMALIKEGYSDFLALNYYASECAKACPKDAGKAIRYSGVNLSGKKGEISGFETHPGFYEMCKNPNLDTTDWDWAIDPIGLEYLFRDIYTRYNKPLMITENGLGAFDELTEDNKIHDDYRIDYLRSHVIAMQRAIDYGVEVLAYCPWSAIDLLSTSNGVKKRYGFIYVDRTDDDPKACKRIRKDSFFWYQNVIKSNGSELN
ncbi:MULTISPECIES: glycoside hydrolase family 1 protein [unclassified Enterococcus]|uniref:glycoside hydrolase family 1 protein n=1 Tax=unclassified Enterococcus TaxID=2608891 RepID=UPI0015551A0D|nr:MULTISPECIES: glycoside hydrolase family 1 protein [unclassified Enterococcus]MBS7576901.1 glycoside hydrolase family 1 protein [Enterococcus sp. MMGLQ5-2]MBS7584308.1 glycoside hydrolase family 1 protein [Enterococcus sp. MMGLQ5-1]NPD12164.1 glycoside hydrolase family 1 protein [Enterococcus sp. MMGLQ5-1]NPD36736.1 glycoside hydrolase family 1 protein [Enterococcus sp. MMGLQ5-2]